MVSGSGRPMRLLPPRDKLVSLLLLLVAYNQARVRHSTDRFEVVLLAPRELLGYQGLQAVLFVD